MGDGEGVDWGSPKTVYGVMLTLITAVSGGFSYHQAQQGDPRPDPFTGTEGRELEGQVHEIAKLFTHFIERGPVDVRDGQKAIQADHKETTVRLARMESYLIACTARGASLRAQMDELEALLQQVQKEQRDHFRRTQ